MNVATREGDEVRVDATPLDSRRRAIHRCVAALAGLAALIVLGTVGLLAADAIAAHLRQPREQAYVTELASKVQGDAAYAPQVHAEYERQTQAALRRQAWQRKLGTILTVAATVLLLSCKWLIARRGQPLYLPQKVYPLTVSAPPGAPAASIASGAGHAARFGAVASAAVETAHVDLSAAEEIIAREGRGPEAAIPILQALQAHYRYLPEAALRRVCERTEISPAQLVGVASFYSQFRRTPVGEHLIKICHGTACHVAGAALISDELRRHLRIGPGEDTDARGRFTIEPVACLGCCTLAPVMQLDGLTHGHLRFESALDVLTRPLPRGPTGLKPVPQTTRVPQVGEIRIGLGSCCVANGSGRVYDAMQAALARDGVHVAVKRVGCVGMCHQTPFVELDIPGAPIQRYGRVSSEWAGTIVRKHFRPEGLTRRLRRGVSRFLERERSAARPRPTPLDPRDPPVAAFLDRQERIATEHCGCLDPTDLDEYLHHDGYRALQRCLAGLSPEEVIEEIRRSGLRGRGGAGFPAAAKWSLVQQASGSPKYIICNGDEGDPGAFMDRMLMESYPYRIIEGMTIAAHATGASEGLFYIRREYTLATQRIRAALYVCEQRGLLGDHALGSGRTLRLRVVEGAGAFVCGEETALIASLEGRRGLPSLRPPFPSEQGLWGRPTLVSNVETYAVVPWILRHGPAAFAALGTPTSPGTKVFALAGKISRGGLIEVPMGITLRQIVEEIGGGVPQGRRFKAVQIGGPSGGCVPAELADTPVDFEALVGVGAMMGSGGLVVLDDRDCMVDMARYFLAFTQDQSCGKCTHCRVGTRRLLDILERLCGGEGRDGDLDKLEHLARMVRQGSLCGLGKTAPNPILTTLRYFRQEYEAHLAGRCPAGRCKALIRYEVTDDCTGCTLCAQHCPADAIAMKPYEKHEIDADKCTRCDVCRVRCPEDAIRVV